MSAAARTKTSMDRISIYTSISTITRGGCGIAA
jgi:hypothetical protein